MELKCYCGSELDDGHFHVVNDKIIDPRPVLEEVENGSRQERNQSKY